MFKDWGLIMQAWLFNLKIILSIELLIILLKLWECGGTP